MDLKKIGNAMAEAGKATRELAEKTKEAAVRAIDQNDDGTFDMTDVGAIVDSAGAALQRTKDALAASAEERSRNAELKALQPIFPDTLESTDFALPKLICVAERDKKHAESPVCQGSVGYFSNQKDFRLVNIFIDSADAFGLSFYPECERGLYYADPTDRDSYIAVEQYFKYLHAARVGELQKIAQTLGAKHFRVTYIEESSSTSRVDEKGQAKVGAGRGKSKVGAGAAVEIKTDEQEKRRRRIDAELVLLGHAPMMPELKYLQKEPCVQNLISIRMDESSPVIHHHLTIKLSDTCGIRETDAIKIDAVLNGIKYEGKFSMANEATKEMNKFLDYDIDF